MKVAIFNAAGAIGARMVETFHLSGSPQPVALAPAPAGLARAARFAVSLKLVDPASTESLRSALSGCSSMVFAPADEDEPARIVESAATLARACAKGAIRRLVMISEAGPADRKAAEPEDGAESLPGPMPGPRSAALAEAEAVLLEVRVEHLPLTIVLRTGTVFGARVPSFAELARGLESGEGPRPLADVPWNGLHLDNLVAATRAALSARIIEQRVFTLTDPAAITEEAFRAAVARELGVSAGVATNLPREPTEGTAHQIQGFNVEKQLGYRPAVDLAEGLRRSCAWWRHARD